MNTEYIYHITSKKNWENAIIVGQYESDTLSIEGFIHCSTIDQVPGVLDRYYKGMNGLVKLTIDKEKIDRPLIYELAGSINEVFPHIHGALNINAVVEVTDI